MLRDAVADRIRIGLRRLDADVERLAYRDGHARPGGRVRDPVLAHETRLPPRILLIDAHGAGRQSRPVIDEAHRHVRRLRGRRVEAICVEGVGLVRNDTDGVHDTDLLRLLRPHRDAARQRVEVVVAHALGTALLRARPDDAAVIVPRRGRDVACAAILLVGARCRALHVARDDRDLGVLERRVRIVGQRRPPLQVQRPVALVIVGHIVRAPCHAPRQVAQLRPPRARPVAVHADGQGRLRAEVRGHVREDDARRDVVIAQDFDAVADLHDDAVVDAQHLRAVRRYATIAGVRADNLHELPDMLLHQLFRAQQVIVEVLLEDRRPSQVECHRRRLDRARHARQLDHLLTVAQRDLPRVRH